jgi:hypothetical protein
MFDVWALFEWLPLATSSMQCSSPPPPPPPHTPSLPPSNPTQRAFPAVLTVFDTAEIFHIQV